MKRQRDIDKVNRSKRPKPPPFELSKLGNCDIPLGIDEANGGDVSRETVGNIGSDGSNEEGADYGSRRWKNHDDCNSQSKTATTESTDVRQGSERWKPESIRWKGERRGSKREGLQRGLQRKGPRRKSQRGIPNGLTKEKIPNGKREKERNVPNR